MPIAQRIVNRSTTWVNASEQSMRALVEINDEFGFEESDIKESLPPLQRAKIVEREGYFFIVLHFPLVDGLHERLRFSEVDFFLLPNTLVTVHSNDLGPLRDLFSHARQGNGAQTALFAGGSVGLFLAIWRALLEFSFTSVMQVNDDINRLDRKLLAKQPNKEIMEELLRLRTNIVTLRRTIGPQRGTLDRFASYGEKMFGLKKYAATIHELREFQSEMWQLLDSHMESSRALHEAVESVVAVHMGDSMKIFTVISVITFPLTLLATLFAVRAGGTPLIDSPGGFWILFWLLLLGAAGMLKLFKKKGLL